MFNLGIFLAQVCVIVGATRLVGYLFKKLDQPQIIGDVTAGILLGPSLLGWLAPAAMTALFPASSLDYLHAVSQVGLLLYMFVVGLKLDVTTLAEKKYTAILTSNGSVICPFLLGSLLAFYLYPRLTDGGVPLISFVLFVGAAMSITAFPVLARILDERGLLRDKIGTIAIACAAVDDITAWLLLAAITVYTQAVGERAMLWLTVPGLIIYFGLMWFVVRPGLLRLHRRNPVRATPGGMSLMFLLLLGSAWMTESLGIHALFGAFFAGYVVPRDDRLTDDISEKVEPVAGALLLPIFFVLTGLRTSITLIAGLGMWAYCVMVIAVAVAGKVGGAMISARLSGMSWRESGAIGVLMNTRGLVELVILNIGLELRVIPPVLFSMMVLMALVTTFMTSPLLSLIYPATPSGQGAVNPGLPSAR